MVENILPERGKSNSKIKERHGAMYYALVLPGTGLGLPGTHWCSPLYYKVSQNTNIREKHSLPRMEEDKNKTTRQSHLNTNSGTIPHHRNATCLAEMGRFTSEQPLGGGIPGEIFG